MIVRSLFRNTVIFCLILPLRAFGEGTNSGTTEDPPILAIWEDTAGGLDFTPGPQFTVAVWRDGRIVWSRNKYEGGAPYHEGRIEPERLTTLLNRLEEEDAFKDKSLWQRHYGPHADYLVIAIGDGTRRLEMLSWHEYFGGVRDGPDKTRFLQIWKDIRETTNKWVPENGTLFKGTIVKPVTSDRNRRRRSRWRVSQPGR